MQNVRNVIRDEVKQEVSPILAEYEAKKKQKEQFLKEKDMLWDEITLRMTRYHPGKWSIKSEIWSCCQTINKKEIGCREIE